MKKIFLILALIFFQYSYSQNEIYLKEKDSTSENKQQMKDYNQSIFYLIHRSWIANKKPSYLSAVPYANSIGNRKIPLREGEGKSSEPYLLRKRLLKY